MQHGSISLQTAKGLCSGKRPTGKRRRFPWSYDTRKRPGSFGGEQAAERKEVQRSMAPLLVHNGSQGCIWFPRRSLLGSSVNRGKESLLLPGPSQKATKY